MEIKWYFKEPEHEEMNDDGVVSRVPERVIEIPLEKWAWHVVYDDGSELHQFDRDEDADGKRWFHQFKEIDQSRVKFFEMVNVENPKLRYSIDVTMDVGQVFHFYRRSRLNIGTPQETKVCFYCFGAVVNGTSIYHFILPDNRIVITTNRDIQLL